MDLQESASPPHRPDAGGARAPLVTASPIEEKILATANEKLDAEAKIIEAGKFNQTSNASGAARCAAAACAVGGRARGGRHPR